MWNHLVSQKTGQNDEENKCNVRREEREEERQKKEATREEEARGKAKMLFDIRALEKVNARHGHSGGSAKQQQVSWEGVQEEEGKRGKKGERRGETRPTPPSTPR